LSNGNFGREEISLPLADTTIFVRGVDDRFTISIDSSGDNLHKRGLKRHHGKAPLRETIAAAALLLAGYSGTEPLIDPMCGTGTFSLEAALMVKNVPPGWYRKFAFMEWPSFRRKQWEYLKRLCEKEFVRPEAPLVFASDKDPAACRKFQKCVREFGLTDTITVFEKTFFELEPEEMTDRLGLIAINPPYGRRFGTLQESAKLFQTICAKLQQVFKGWKLVLIAPSTQLADKIPFKLEAHIFRHGGLKLTLMVGKIT
jgi:putative N6-adenine-specific DNA methylase